MFKHVPPFSLEVVWPHTMCVNEEFDVTENLDVETRHGRVSYATGRVACGPGIET